MTRTQSLIAAISVMALALISSPAGAIPLPPGLSFPPSPFIGSPGTQLATTGPVNFTSTLGAADFSGTVTEAVYRDAVTGNLDFVYQFHNNAGSLQSIEQMSASLYDGFTTDVQQDTTVGFDGFTGGGVAALSADRSVSGQNVAFQFSGTLPPPQVLPGLTSAILMIATNATAFDGGNVSFINTGTATLTNMFAPSAAVTSPEPGTLLLVGTGLVGLVGIARKWKRR